MNCTLVSNETFAAFMDGRLDEVARARVLAHVVACDNCYALFDSLSEELVNSQFANPLRRG